MANRLISAAKRSDQVALKRAITSYANLNCEDSQGWTPLFHAAHHGNTDAVKLLIQTGADVNHGIKTGFTALFSAVMSQHVETVRILLEAGAKVVPMADGTELRGWALTANAKKRHELVAMLDSATSNLS